MTSSSSASEVLNKVLNKFKYLFAEELYIHSITLESGVLCKVSDKLLIELENGTYRPYLVEKWTKVGEL